MRGHFLRGHNGRLRLVQSEGMHLVTTTAEGVSDRAVPFVTSTGLVIGGAHTRPAPLPAPLPNAEERAVQRALLKRPTRDVSGSLVFWACIGFAFAVGGMALAGWLK